MVKNGLQDWIIQRISAVVIGAYTIFLLFFLFMHPHLKYDVWQSLFNHAWVRIFSLIALLSVMLHAWIGVWTIFTDYIKVKWLRLSLQVIVILALWFYFFWGVEILWGL